eukprot:evm.model.scf_558EXC.10 EVM.evm.TU.scf_558EXC.10   scf_558EXC:71533-76705(-)
MDGGGRSGSDARGSRPGISCWGMALAAAVAGWGCGAAEGMPAGGGGGDGPGALRALLQGSVDGCDPNTSTGNGTDDCTDVGQVEAKESGASAGGIAVVAILGVLLLLGLVMAGTGYYFYKKDPEKFFNKYRNLISRVKKTPHATEHTSPMQITQQPLPLPQPIPVRMRPPEQQRPRLVPVPVEMQRGSHAPVQPPWQILEAGVGQHSVPSLAGYARQENWGQVVPPRVVPPVTVQGRHDASNQSTVAPTYQDAHSQVAEIPSQPAAQQGPQPYPGSAVDHRVSESSSAFYFSVNSRRSGRSSSATIEDSPSLPQREQDAEALDGSSDQEPQQDLNYDIRVRPICDKTTALGSGAFGTVEPGVFTDEDGKIVHVAVKYGSGLFDTKKPHEVASVLRSELDVLGRVPAHPNIVLCYGGRVDFKEGEHIGHRDVYIVEELMHSNLHDIIHGDEFEGKLPFSLILKIALDIASGLEHLHRCSVIHYDLKPANVLVDENLRVAKIADFGISKVKFVSYVTGTMKGTFGYMAPEVMVANFVNVQINEKIDVYSFGVVLWEMVEGKLPSSFLDDSTRHPSAERPPAPIYMVPTNEDRFPITRPCPEPLKRLVHDCLSMDASERPTAREARERVYEMLSANRQYSGASTDIGG